MKNKSVLILLFLLLSAASYILAEEPANGLEGYHEIVDSWINGEIDSDVLLEEIDELEGTLIREVETWENLYWRSRIALLRGQIHYENKDKKSSLAELEKSHLLIRASIDIQEHSDSWRVMSEASSVIMIQRGLPYIILNFRKGQNQAKKSLELDPQNARAHLIVARFLTNAPRIAGGNKGKGLKILQNQASRSDLIDEDRFYILLSLNEALEKNNQTDQAARVYQEALRIFPGYRNGQTFKLDLE